METQVLALSSIELDAAVNIRDQLDEETIQWYMEIFDQLPPVVAYQWNGRLLLADGFHRYAAAERLGKREIEVEIREGTQEDAWVYAAIANFRHGRNLSLLERDRAIERVATFRPDWTQQRIAEEFGIAKSTVQNAIRAIGLRRDLADHHGGQTAQTYQQRNLTIASRATDVETAGRLLETAERESWTRDELQAAVRTVNDPDLPDEYKERMIAGKAPPILSGGRILTGTIEKVVAHAKKYDAIGALWTVTTAIGHLRQLGVEAVRDQATPKDAESILRFLDEDIDLLRHVKRTLEDINAKS